MKASSWESSENPNFQPMTAASAAAPMGVLRIPEEQTGQHSSRIAIKVKGKILFIRPSDVVAIEAQGNYVLLQQDASSYLLRDSISVVAEKLEPYGFIRIHRSVLVNASFVDIISPYATGEYCLRLKGGKEYTVTRTYKNNLKYLAKFWIGTGAFFTD